MAGHTRLRSFFASNSTAILSVGLLAALCLAFMTAIPARASADAYAPVAAYSFDEGEGTTVEDVTGDGHTGTVEGASWARGHYGDALEFDGAEDCVTVPASPELELREELTVEAWIKPEGTGEAESIVFKEAEGEFFGYTLFVGLQASGRIEGLVANDAETEYAPTVTSPHTIRDNVWTHVAMTYDGRHERLYVNGELVDTEIAEPPIPNAAPLRIGCAGEHEASFTGRIDEVRIYDRALNGPEVDSDMETPLQTPRQGPVAAYSFDEGEGTTVEDLTGDGNEGTIEGAKRTTHGRYGSALEFDGSGEDCVTVPDSPALELREELTIEAWVKPEGSGEAESILFKEADEGEWFGYTLFLGLQQDGKIEGMVSEDPDYAVEVVSPHTIPDNVWTHVAMTYDGRHERLYIDGELVDTELSGPPIANTGPLKIGCAGEHEAGFDGRIDEVRLYDRALNGPEVDSDMETPIQTPKQGPVAAYSFDEGEGTTVEDITGDGNEGTIEGASWARGRYGDALEFDGHSSCVSVPESESLRLGEEFTLEAWVRPEGTLGEEPLIFEESEGGPSVVLGIGIGAGGKPEGWAEGEEITAPHEIERDVWTHLAYTYDGGRMRLFVDGEQVASRWVGSETLESEGPLRVGCWPGHEYSEARIDEVRLYDRALNGPEVDSDMETPIQTPKQGPVAAYSFDEGEGTTVEDITGDGNEGTIEGASWARGRYGDALEFDGHSSCVSVPESESLRLGEEFTLEAWVRPEGTLGEEPLIFEESEGGPSVVLGIGIGAGGKPEGWAEGEEITAPHEIERDVWTHLAYTYDGGRMRLFVDGEQVASRWVGSETLESEGPLRVGCWPGHEYSEARIDEVRLYDRALNGPEVDSDMETPIQTPKQGPVAAYSFDEGEGTTVEDITGDGNTATIEGAEWTTHGKYGGAMEFDGAGAQLTVPDSPELRLSEEFTLEAWVRPDQVEGLMPVVAKTAPGEYGYGLYAADGESPPVPEGFLSEGEYVHGYAYSPHLLAADTWTHLAVSFDGSRLRFYVDGELVDTRCAEELPIGEGPLTIGGDEPFAEGGFFKGRIDEVRIYNRALTQQEIDSGMTPLPSIQTTEAYGAEGNEAAFTGTVNPHGQETTYGFEYGLTTSYGTSVPSSPELAEDVLVGTEPIEITETVDTLEPETTYHYRSVAWTALGAKVVGHDHTVTTGPSVSPLAQLAKERKEMPASKSWHESVGINWSGNLSKTSGARTMEEVSKSGASDFRVVIGDPAAENKAKYDHIFEHAALEGVTILPDIVGFGGHGNLMANVNNPSIRKTWETKISDIVERYGPNGAFWKEHETAEPGVVKLPEMAPGTWEIWNEENYGANGDLAGNPNPALFGKVLGIAHRVITELHPSAKIVIGGLLTVGTKGTEPHMPVPAFIERVGHLEDYDILSLHPYAFKGLSKKNPNPHDPEDVAHVVQTIETNIRNARKALNKQKEGKLEGKEKKIWITEIGWPVKGAENDEHHLPVDEKTQAELLGKTFTMIKERSGTNPGSFDIGKFFFYNLQDWVEGNLEPVNWAAHCGLLEDVGRGESNFRKREAWSVFQEQAK